jgi:hypothetical protein
VEYRQLCVASARRVWPAYLGSVMEFYELMVYINAGPALNRNFFSQGGSSQLWHTLGVGRRLSAHTYQCTHAHLRYSLSGHQHTLALHALTLLIHPLTHCLNPTPTTLAQYHSPSPVRISSSQPHSLPLFCPLPYRP